MEDVGVDVIITGKLYSARDANFLSLSFSEWWPIQPQQILLLTHGYQDSKCFMLPQLGPHLLLLLFLCKWVRCIQFSLFTLHKPQELVDWAAHPVLCQAEALWHLDYESLLILYRKDLAGHSELMCPPLCRGENGYFTSTFTQLHLLLKTCMTNHPCKLLHTKLNVGWRVLNI